MSDPVGPPPLPPFPVRRAGTPDYEAPEKAAGCCRVGPESDAWSAALVLCELVDGTRDASAGLQTMRHVLAAVVGAEDPDCRPRASLLCEVWQLCSALEAGSSAPSASALAGLQQAVCQAAELHAAAQAAGQSAAPGAACAWEAVLSQAQQWLEYYEACEGEGEAAATCVVSCAGPSSQAESKACAAGEQQQGEDGAAAAAVVEEACRAPCGPSQPSSPRAPHDLEGSALGSACSTPGLGPASSLSPSPSALSTLSTLASSSTTPTNTSSSSSSSSSGSSKSKGRGRGLGKAYRGTLEDLRRVFGSGRARGEKKPAAAASSFSWKAWLCGLC